MSISSMVLNRSVTMRAVIARTRSLPSATRTVLTRSSSACLLISFWLMACLLGRSGGERRDERNARSAVVVVDGRGVPAQRLHLDVHVREQRQARQHVMHRGGALDVEDAAVGVAAGNAPTSASSTS